MPLLQAIGLFAERLFAAPDSAAPTTKTTARLLEGITKLLYKLTPESFTLSPPVYPIEFYPLYETNHFTMCIFVLKNGATMPTHDHPGMSVFTKLISGSMQVKTYEILKDPDSSLLAVDPISGSPLQLRRAHVGMNKIVSADSPDSLLTINPISGPNMHSFTAVSDHAVFIDILGPPYNNDRVCTYFRELPLTSFGMYCPTLLDGGPPITPPASATTLQREAAHNNAVNKLNLDPSSKFNILERAAADTTESRHLESSDLHYSESQYFLSPTTVTQLNVPGSRNTPVLETTRSLNNNSLEFSSLSPTNILSPNSEFVASYRSLSPHPYSSANDATFQLHSQLCSHMKATQIETATVSPALSPMSSPPSILGSIVPTERWAETVPGNTTAPETSASFPLRLSTSVYTRPSTSLPSDFMLANGHSHHAEGATTTVWLLEHPDMEYDCYEREYNLAGGSELIPLVVNTPTVSLTAPQENRAMPELSEPQRVSTTEGGVSTLGPISSSSSLLHRGSVQLSPVATGENGFFNHAVMADMYGSVNGLNGVSISQPRVNGVSSEKQDMDLEMPLQRT
ncbi:hypothetical protein BASA83_007447 [Batrachochytrium salamandrivorans]|nr:hypothetical protein BASA62_000121 [Batrachochytrium salamandrivorans]KAH9270447.1 hypothetical protein BASA83_007447 [Batrachochytrium salamandrivorans]